MRNVELDSMTRPPEPRLEDFIQAIPGPAIVLRKDERVAAVNEAFLDELAAEDAYRETIVGASLGELADSLDATVIEPLRKALACERLSLPGVLLWPFGAKQPERFDVNIARIDAAHSLITFTLDPEDTALLSESRRIQRLACLGMAASGVAHDLNNHLAASMNTASLLAEELTSASPHSRALEIIVGSSSEAAGLARKLLAFAGHGQPQIRPLSLEKLVADAALLVRHELPRDGRIHFEFTADDRELHGDATQIEHAALLMLLRTARALDSNKIATVRSRRVDVPHAQLSNFKRRLAAGSYIGLEFTAPVTSEGAPTVDDILVTVDAIAVEHGGGLVIERSENEETVRILLAVARIHSADRSENEPNADATREDRTVLIVDDDAMVRDVAVAMVRRLGYVALAATSGEEALSVLRSKDTHVDLVILDLVLGDIDGRTVLLALTELEHRPKVIVSSGFGQDDSMTHMPKTVGTLEKPYTLAALRQALVRAFSNTEADDA